MKIAITLGGQSHDLQVKPIDHMRYSDTARKHNWPLNPETDPLRFAYFCAFAAAQRTNLISTEQGFNSFLESVDDIDLDTGDIPPTEAAN